MKAIILAAGRGTRLNKYTKDLPKGMLNVFGKSILEQQVALYRKAGISDISIVRGYMAQKIEIDGVRAFDNIHFATTNMVESLFVAREKLDGDVIISYADILFTPDLLGQAMSFTKEIGVVVDLDWQEYWNLRYKRIDFDTESMRFDAAGKIIELGKENPPLSEINGRYVGMIRLSHMGSTWFKAMYDAAASRFRGKIYLGGRTFENIFMTDFLQELIRTGKPVWPILVRHGWLEFDTNEDYEIITEAHAKNSLSAIFDPN